MSEIIDHTSQFPHCFRSRCCRAELPEAEAPAGQTEVPKAHELLERGPRGRVGRKYRISTSSPPEKLDAATSLLYPDIFRLETVSIPGSFSKRPAAAAFSASYMPGQSIPPSRRFANGSPLNRSRFRGESRLIKLSSAIFTLTRLLLNRFMRLQKG